jgi:glycosyltransferase involved in cell wall biosynthesis
MVGGAERQGVVQIRGLRALGIEVIPVTGGPQTAWLERQFERSDITDYVVLDPFPHLSTRKLSSPRRLLEYLGNARALISARMAVEKLAHERQVDVVLANSVHGWVTTGSLFRRDPIPLVWRTGTRLGTHSQRLGVALLAAALRPGAVLANCRALVREMEPLVDCSTHLVENGIDGRQFDPATVVPRFRHGGRPIVGIVTRPQPEKGMQLLAAVVEKLAARVPAVQFLIAGGGYRRAEFEARFRQRGLEAHARFVGHVDDIESFYASCDVMILTSRSRSAEASSNALLEAMAMERPVVATRVCGMPEMIKDGREGWLVGEGDAAEFVERIAQLLADEGLRTRMGRAGRRRVLRRFGEEQMAQRLAEVLSACVKMDHGDTETGELPEFSSDTKELWFRDSVSPGSIFGADGRRR